MKFCPMCGTSQSNSDSRVCWLCDYEERRLEDLSTAEIDELMSPYEYEMLEDGARIRTVKNARDMRGSVGIPHFVTEIAPHAFSDCKFLARIGLPKGLRFIGDYAFAYCRDLFDVFIPSSVGYIGKGAFADCHDLGVISAAASAQPEGWNDEWLEGSSARVEWIASF